MKRHVRTYRITVFVLVVAGIFCWLYLSHIISFSRLIVLLILGIIFFGITHYLYRGIYENDE